jgi:5'-3' exonuclease
LQDGFTVEQFIDYKALRGDTSDNVPGIPGVGEKTAKQLLDKYGSLENILQNAHEIPGKLGQNIQNNEELALLSKELVTINCNVPVECTLDDIAFTPVYSGEVRAKLGELENQKSAFSQYKSRVGWDQKKANLDTKTAAVTKIQKQIDTLEAELAVFEKGKVKAIADLAATEKSIETMLAKIRAGQDRSSEINKALEPYFNDKKRIETSILAVEQNYQLKKQEFTAELMKQ